MRRPRTIGYPNEVRQFDSFFSSSLPFVTGRGVVRALSLRARMPISGFAPCIWNPSLGRSDISGELSGWFSGASDRSAPIASQHATARIAISSKMKDMVRTVVPFVVWHECCNAICKSSYPQKAVAQEQT
jgi:hypothetical protein